MSAFLVLQFGMAAASVHCCQNGKLYALRQVCTSLFLYFRNLCSLPGMAVDSGRPCTILFSLSFRSPSLGFPPGKCWVARWASQIACSDAAGWRGFGGWQPEISRDKWAKIGRWRALRRKCKDMNVGETHYCCCFKHSWLWCLVLFWFWYTDITDIYCIECST